MTNTPAYIVGLIAALAVGAGGTFAYYNYIAPASSGAHQIGAPIEDTSAVLITVNGRTITQKNLDDRKQMVEERIGGMFAQLPATEQDRVIKENLILEALVDEQIELNDVASDPVIAAEIADSRQQVLRTAYLDKLAEAAVTEDLLRSAYAARIAEMPDIVELHARHILTKDEAKAQDLIAQIKGGASFETLAKENSMDKGNAAQGGDLGFFTKEEMVPEFATAAFALEAGQISQEPVKTAFGYHVVEVLEKRVKPKPAFEEMKDELTAEERQKFIKAKIDEWRATATITGDVPPPPAPPAAPEPMSAPMSAPAEATAPVDEAAPVTAPAATAPEAETEAAPVNEDMVDAPATTAEPSQEPVAAPAGDTTEAEPVVETPVEAAAPAPAPATAPATTTP